MIKPDLAIREINVKVETLKHPTILFLAILWELNIESGDSLLLLKNFEKIGDKNYTFVLPF
jgi:hypothetical protein